MCYSHVDCLLDVVIQSRLLKLDSFLLMLLSLALLLWFTSVACPYDSCDSQLELVSVDLTYVITGSSRPSAT